MAGRRPSFTPGCQRYQQLGLEGSQKFASSRHERDSEHLGAEQEYAGCEHVNSMQAVILAGGLGTRLWPLTKTVPKPMVPVAGVPYLEHQLQLLKKQSILDIILLTGYLGDQVEEYFSDGRSLGLAIRYSREDQPCGTAGDLRDARTLLADSCLLIYGDSYLPIHYPA